MNEKPMPFVTIAGIIGAGKSSLTELLCLELQKSGYKFEPYFEHVDNNPYLDAFYSAISALEKASGSNDPWMIHHLMTQVNLEAFALQIFFLNERYIDHKRIQYNTERGKGAIQDRSIFEDSIFVNMLAQDNLIRPQDKENYEKNYRIKEMHFKAPDLTIFLDVTPEVAKNRMLARGRDCEKNLPIEYLVRLREEYLNWVNVFEKKNNVMVVDWNGSLEDNQFLTEEIIDTIISLTV